MMKTITKSLYGYSLSLKNGKQAEVYDGTDVKWVFTGGAALNRIFGAQFSVEETDQHIVQIQTMFERWNVPAMWLTDPFTHPHNLGSYLEQHGWSRSEDWIGMALDLSLQQERPSLPSSLRIIPAVQKEAFQMWSRVILNNGSQRSHVLLTALEAIFTTVSVLRDASWHPYLGFLNGDPVVTAGLFTEDNIAGIYWVATEPTMRKQGLATAMMQYILWEAHEQGYRYAVLQATRMGQSVYSRLGFQKYGLFGVYQWQPG